MIMIAFGIACMAVYALNAWAAADAKPRHADAAGVASLLCVSYGLSNALVSVYGFPEAILGFPMMDAALAFMVWRACKRNYRTWKALLIGLLVVQMTAHAIGITVWHSGGVTRDALYAYAVLINATFAGQLAVVGSAGALHAVARIVHWVSDLRRASAYGNAQ